MKKQPEQTKATRQKLIDAFWSIYKIKDLNKIAIGEITKTAEFNRSTFYEYFLDIYDILLQIEDELLENIKTDMEITFSNGFPNSIQEFSLLCSRVFRKYDDRLFLLMGSSGDPKFKVKLQNIFLNIFKNIAGIYDKIPNYDYVIAFIYSAMIGMMEQWYEDGKDLSEEKFVCMLQKLIATGVIGFSDIPLFIS